MGLARKGSRQITVQGERNRWAVSGNDGFLDQLIEPTDGAPGGLCVQFDYSFGSMTPGQVRQILLQALAIGWPFEWQEESQHFRAVGDQLVPIR